MWPLLLLTTFATLVDSQFRIDYENDTFLMNNKPFQYVSGSMHYFRCPRIYWRDRLRKLREAGLNAVSTYVEWSQHERIPGQFDFSGDLNIAEFIRTASEEDLFVILRPGPYICAERDMGGLPYWLMRKNPNINLRSADPSYTKYVQRWLEILMAEMEPFLFGNGGPIIMVQVENEYGSYPACDMTYLTWLRDLFLSYVGDKAVLFTTDGAGTKYLQCGKIPGVFATVDFGPVLNVTKAFEPMRKYEPHGPLVNSEFYPGWLTHLGEPLAITYTEPIVDTLKEMLDMGANVNFYMFHGGSNFGFSAGANFGSTYQSDLTSYDYDAPLTEAGDLTSKYEAIRDVLFEYFPERRKKKRAVKVATKGDYGTVRLSKVGSLFSSTLRGKLGRMTSGQFPQSFESLDQNFGYLLYETTAQTNNTTPQSLPLQIVKFSDRALIYVNDVYMGQLSREMKINTLPIIVKKGDRIGILVENLGRINAGALNNDSKGILSDVALGQRQLTNWNMTSFELNNIDEVYKCAMLKINTCLDDSPIKVYQGSFEIHVNSSMPILPDSFLNTTNLNKGLIYINGFNLGRYWQSRGPQYTLYVPGVLLNSSPSTNTIVIIDEKLDNQDITVNFSTSPLWSSNVKVKKFTV